MSARRQRGFTLLEVMVAFVVLAVALGLLLGVLSRGLQQISRAQAETEATLHAQSLLDSIGTLEAIEPGMRDGDFDRGKYRWRLQVSESQDPAPPPPPTDGAPLPPTVETSGAPLLYRVALEVEWGNRERPQKLRFDTLRLRAPPGENGDLAAAGDTGASP